MARLVAQKMSVVTDMVRTEGNQLYESARRIDKVYDKLVNRNNHLENQNTISAGNRLTEVISDIEYYLSGSIKRLDKANEALDLFADQGEDVGAERNIKVGAAFWQMLTGCSTFSSMEDMLELSHIYVDRLVIIRELIGVNFAQKFPKILLIFREPSDSLMSIYDNNLTKLTNYRSNVMIILVYLHWQTHRNVGTQS